ncbi:MsnO8 family LLM class oxidoreductase [Nocardiopsis dassonvillei]|uniref:Luciferase family oxidoreductase, group 1 n=1 Tax=Nocardiopsis dassonvillei (strain ATCC 23218 / DSM 43111 / CIP 107115 / JCM 7437 / KCTC 9190 / NBRC 14626 / NCTC 10488 / NRRL B-5397 / IMRU 509) TaxID=446468 RepID=D7B644_NOCDD|nr:MsnO8 family LLM class oxidoreductase [Nocardiopsis dassonvillei]ADH67309.1 luciferase family oxidoreductase, group 1 [Nocardiopsis dassonvillei subsp. dassonvillei DSM 43111]NKY77312.1 MsnO8 family LLM class oxidoreductase [Nocardiopsis dassonvillei]VEI87434.1 Limonene 1,2-monooxygenase [Nocardiopsis dassonvillei]
MRVSLLDRSRTRSGEADAQTIATTVERAVRAEELGFHRFWTAEHHAVPGIASSAPTVLLAAIGARTRDIRLGTGGVMVPNHSPLVVAEQALLLEALFPGRIDLGLGGSLGFTAPIRRALGRTVLGEGEYPAEVERVREYLSGRAGITARPSVAPPPVFLLAVREGLALAAELGLPAVIGGPVLRDPDRIAAYFEDFRPSRTAPAPYLVVNVDVSVAETEERARDLLLPEAWAYADSREAGEFRALRPVEEVRRLLGETSRDRKRGEVHGWMDSAIAGTPEQVADALTDLLDRTGGSEVLANVSTYDRDEVRRTDEFLASLQAR